MKKNMQVKSNGKSNKNNNTITNVHEKTTKSNDKSVGFDSEDGKSFELDENSEHSFELRDCK